MSIKNWLRFLAVGVTWGTSFLWIKIALEEIGPLMVVAFRSSFGLVGMVFILLFTNRKLLTWQNIKPWLGLFFLIGITNAALPFVFISWGEQFIPSGIASVLISTTPLFTILMVTFFMREDSITLTRAIGLVLGFGGVIVLFIPELRNSHLENLFGLLAVLTAAASYALSGILVRKKVHGLDSRLQVLMQYITAALLVWMLTFIFEKPITLPKLPLTWIALLWLGLLGSSMASFFHFQLIHSIGPTRTSAVAYVQPMVGVLLGALILGEGFGWQTLIGGILIVAGIMLVNRRDAHRKPD